jgi:hypothetical protein
MTTPQQDHHHHRHCINHHRHHHYHRRRHRQHPFNMELDQLSTRYSITVQVQQNKCFW